MTIRERSSPILSVDFSTLAPYTRYPFGLLLPQDITERVLTTKLEGLGVKVFRPYKLIGMSTNVQNGDIVDVSFEGGQVIQASYVIGADGARSAVCEEPSLYIRSSVQNRCLQNRSVNWLESAS